MDNNKQNEILELLKQLNIKYAIEDSYINLKIYDTRIKYYQTLINNLTINKPMFFEVKKLKKINAKIDQYNNMINDLYIQMGKEFELIISLKEQNDKLD